MQRISTKALLMAVGMAGALAADVSAANAQEGGQDDPSADSPMTPKAPEASTPAKTGEARPGPLDVVVMFQPNSAELQAGSNAKLEEVAEWLKQDPSRKASVEPHPDETARADFDAGLVDERADATRRFLTGKGASDSQVLIATSGKPAAAESDHNHRTVFMMSAEGQGETAAAEPEPAPEPAPIRAPQAATRMDDDPSDDHLLTRFGMSVTVGGGVVDFMDGEARDLGDMGGAWEARLAVGTRMPIAIEAAYVGAAHDVNALGLDDSAVLLGTSAEADVRLNIASLFGAWTVQPYVFGGIGYTRYDVTNEDFNTSSVNDEEELGHIPVGAGIGYQWRGLLVDLRGTMRPAFQDDLVNEPADEDDPLDETDTATDLDTWSVAARAGWEF
jgi:outer membrane protein OmpA-like peptidoglycan-associated protein